jgi:hypothetical protein
MNPRRSRRAWLVPISLAMILAATILEAPGAVADTTPTLRLFAGNTEVTVRRDRDGRVRMDPGVWLTPVGGAFEMWVSRPDYDTPVSLTQVDAVTRQVLRTLPVDMLEGWFGLDDFGSFEIATGNGTVVRRDTFSFCLNTFNRQRLNDEGPLNSDYPWYCSGGPFTRGAVMGIDDGWAISFVDGYYGFSWVAPRNNYTLTFSIQPEWVEALGIAPEDATAQVHVTVEDRGGHGGHRRQAAAATTPEMFPSTPTITNPDPASLPDLIALPGWGISTYRQRGRDILGFNATEWNAGPGTLVVEGFRGQNETEMEAFQYFLIDGQPIGRAPIGALEYHQGGNHNHWHFEEFTQYSLLDATKTTTLISGKQSWCLANTDAIDLTVPGASWQGFNEDLSTMCGGPSALWIREVLDVGWGDTYSQFRAGQAFDITDVPNGTYYIRVQVNPTGAMLESTTANNVEDREIRLRGRPGHRRVTVSAWHGIDA